MMRILSCVTYRGITAELDMEVCEIEGWDKLEYMRTLQKEIGGLGSAYIITKQDTDHRA